MPQSMSPPPAPTKVLGRGAKHGQPFMALDILPLDETVHLGLQPADVRTVIALGLHNFAKNYAPPPDAAKMALPRATVSMTVKLRLEQVVIWLHPGEKLPAVSRLEVRGVALDVSKNMQLITSVQIGVGSVALHGRWQTRTDAPPHWLQMLGAPMASCAIWQ